MASIGFETADFEVPVELAGYLRRRRAGRRLRFHAAAQLHLATVRALTAEQANEHDPDRLRPLLRALIDDLVSLAGELWIVVDMLGDDDDPAPERAARGSR